MPPENKGWKDFRYIDECPNETLELVGAVPFYERDLSFSDKGDGTGRTPTHLSGVSCGGSMGTFWGSCIYLIHSMYIYIYYNICISIDVSYFSLPNQGKRGHLLNPMAWNIEPRLHLLPKGDELCYPSPTKTALWESLAQSIWIWASFNGEKNPCDTL